MTGPGGGIGLVGAVNAVDSITAPNVGSVGTLIYDQGAGAWYAVRDWNISDPATGGGIPATWLYTGAGSMVRQRTPTVFKTLNAVVVTSETTIWTPAAGKKFRLMGFYLAQGVATGAITLRDNTAGTTILIVPQNTVGVASASPPLGNGILSAAANNVLTAQGASTETLTGFVFGTEE